MWLLAELAQCTPVEEAPLAWRGGRTFAAPCNPHNTISLFSARGFLSEGVVATANDVVLRRAMFPCLADGGGQSPEGHRDAPLSGRSAAMALFDLRNVFFLGLAFCGESGRAAYMCRRALHVAPCVGI